MCGMDQTLTYTIFILLGLLILGLAFLAKIMFDMKKKIKMLLGGGKGGGDPQKDLLRRVVRAETKLEEVEPRLQIVEGLSKISVQKVGFLRFNPFQDTGGDNSFVIALLDRENNGVLVSSLYTRGGVRVYGKSVGQGKSKQPLSQEEQKVLEEAVNKGIKN